MSHNFDEQLNGKNRFGDEIVATTQNTVDAGFEVILAGDKDDRRSAVLRPRADLFAKLESIQLRHLDIEQNQRVILLLETFQSKQRVVGGVNL